MPINLFDLRFGSIAQLVEQETLNFEVVGSNPSTPTIRSILHPIATMKEQDVNAEHPFC